MTAIQTAIAQIEAYIIANGTEDITANVLRPLMVALGNAVESVTGDPANLVVTSESNLVQAINAARALAVNAGGPKRFMGSADPNVTPPLGYVLYDYYARYLGVTLLAVYQYNGYNWIEII